ncbi:hypothetical protein FQN53_003913 [Emmonsiellopsis sp. PD_33]|nr:hypothetical protein FQN53_003913 [Emmonsiellopsis sp. PD_33]
MKWSILASAISGVALAMPKPQGGGQPSPSGSGPYPAGYTTIPDLPSHTIYRPLEVPENVTVPVLAWGEGACSADGLQFLNFLTEVASHGVFVFASGPPGGQGSTTAQLLFDAVDWATANGGSGDYAFIDPSRIAVAGMSCGGIEAYELVGDERVSQMGIFNSGFFTDEQAQGVVPGIAKPIFYFLGGESDIAYQNGERDYDLLSESLPAWKGNLPVGHGGTYQDENGGKFGVAAVNWLKWTLRGEADAAEFFTGGAAEGDGWSVESQNLDALELSDTSRKAKDMASSLEKRIADVLTFAEALVGRLFRYTKSVQHAEFIVKKLAYDSNILAGNLNCVLRLANCLSDEPVDVPPEIHSLDKCQEIISKIDEFFVQVRLEDLRGLDVVARRIKLAPHLPQMAELRAELGTALDNLNLALDAESFASLLRLLSPGDDKRQSTTEPTASIPIEQSPQSTIPENAESPLPTGESLELNILLKDSIKSEDLALLKSLLEKGVDVHHRTYGISPLEFACERNIANKAILYVLLDHADPSRINEINHEDGGLGLIHYAGMSNTPGVPWIIEELVKRGADPNLRVGIKPYRPAVVYHLMNRSFDSAHALLKNGADPSLCCKIGFDAALAAVWRGATTFLMELSRWESPSQQLDWQRSCEIHIVRGRETLRFLQANALHLAALGGYPDSLEFYVDRRLLVDLNSTASAGWTPIHFASMGGHGGVIKYLSSKGADINVRTNTGLLPLHLAVNFEKLDAIDALLDLGAQNAPDLDGTKPSMLALQLGNQPIIDRFRRVPTIQNTTASGNKQFGKLFEIAIRDGDLGRCKELYRQSGLLHIDLLSRGGLCPLILAIQCQQSEIIGWLLEEGALTTKTARGRDSGLTTVALMVEQQALNPFLPTLLEKYVKDGGTDLFFTENPLSTAIYARNTKGFKIILAHLKQNAEYYYSIGVVGHTKRAIKHLVSHPGRYNIKRQSPLHVAAAIGNTEVANILLRNGASLNVGDADLWTPLHCTLRSIHMNMAMVVLLLRRGASIEARDNKGYTPLMTACLMQEMSAVDILIDYGANINARSWTNMSLLHGSTALSSKAGGGGSLSLFFRLSRLGLDPHAQDSAGVSPIHCAMVQPRFRSLLLNGDFVIEDTAPYPWQYESPTNLSWLGPKFRPFRRRIPFGKLQKIINLEPQNTWSPLCRAASCGKHLVVENLISMGADFEYEGCPAGTALMAACEAGELGAVDILVRRGAAISYWGRDGFRCALDVGYEFESIVNWLLVGRFMDQMKLDNVSNTEAPVKPWSGIGKAELVLYDYEIRQPHESGEVYCSRMVRIKKNMRGRIVPPPRRSTETQSPVAGTPNEPVRAPSEGIPAASESQDALDFVMVDPPEDIPPSC